MTSQPKSGFRVGPDGDPDRYVLGAAVASGAEGILYRGSITTGTGLELDVAIKMLQPRFLSQVDQWHARWSEQVELLRSLQVPGVVRVRDGFMGPLPHSPGEAAGNRTLYLVMNWVDGEPLDEWVRRRADRDPLDALKLLLGVAVALDLMHSGRATGGVPVVHRDVKPSNILVTDEGSVLVDFGLTRGLPAGHRTSGITGTPGYLPPEATESGTYTPATDRYSLGAVAYFVLTGAEPPTDHDPATIRSTLSAIPALAACPDTVELLMAMLDTDPALRPTSLGNWIGQLRRSSLTSLPDVLAPEAPARNPQPAGNHGTPQVPFRGGPRRFRRGRRHVLLLAAAAVLPLLALATIGLTGDDPAVRNSAAGAMACDKTASTAKAPLPPPTTGGWRAIPAGPLATRGEPKAVWTGTELIVVGGLIIDQYRAINDGAAFNPSTEKWRTIPPRPTGGRVLHAVWTCQELVTFATEGIGLDEITTVHAFNPVANTWRTLPLPPSTRSPSSVAWTGRQLVYWQPEATPPGALYDPVIDRWSPIPVNSVEGAASAGQAVWTGQELAVQGSVIPASGGPLENRLFLFSPDRGSWRVSSPPAGQLNGWLYLSPIWTGAEVILTSQGGRGAAATYAYDLRADRWRTIANPDTSVAPGYFDGVRLDDGRVVVRVGNPEHPLQILDPTTGTWSSSGPPPGPLPMPGGALASTGTSVFSWGIASAPDGLSGDPRTPNAAWFWSPDES